MDDAGGQRANAGVDVLGPLRLTVDGAVVDVRGPRRRAVLALLALAHGRTVSMGEVLDALWPIDPPETARATVHSHVSRLRGHLGAASARLETSAGGYRLSLDDDALDVGRARSLLARARAVAGSDPDTALRVLGEAESLWRGAPLPDLAEVPPLAAAAAGFEQLMVEISDFVVESLIASGAAAEATRRAAAAVAADPLREPAVLLLVRAQAASGRAPTALTTAREYRRRLVEEAGLDPSPALGDLERAVAAGQVPVSLAPRAPRDAPPPTSVSTPGDLPRPGSRLRGRDQDVTRLTRMLGQERLVTLVGPGGVGKTRLALELACRAETATTLMLGPVTDPAAIPYALADALGVQGVTGDVVAACVAALADGEGLLVVDNCEHVLAAAGAVVDAVLGGAPGATVLATSREPLAHPDEALYRLAALPLPPVSATSDALPAVASVAVFLDRAARAGFDPAGVDLQHVAEIVRRLEGLPLAIELAAGRLSTFSPGELAQRLDRALDLLGSSGLHTRHRTLRATVAWSYDLLSEEEQRLFRHLSAFADGVDLTTAEAVAADLGTAGDPGSVLARLVDASMVEAVRDDHQRDAAGRTRFRMLEPLRGYGHDRLAAAGEADDADARLLRWAVDLTRWIDRTSTTNREAESDAALRRELGNLRTAWRRARIRGETDAAVEFIVALGESAAWRDLIEIRRWADELIDDPALVDHHWEARVWGVASQDAYLRGDASRADRLARGGLERAGGDAEGRRSCLGSLAQADLARAAFDDAVTHDVEAADLATRPGPQPGVGALAALYGGDPERARALADAIPIADVPTLHGFAAYVRAEIDTATGHYDRAEERYVRATEIARSTRATFLVAIASVGLAAVRSRAGRVGDALRGYREVVEYWAEGGHWSHQWVTLRNLADLLRALDDHETAELLDAAADRAPDAPGAGAGAADPTLPAPGRHEALEAAREALERHLAGR